ncbi:MAG TPA: AAA family ATPase [Bacillota bacterium]|nr:AAA family ATPase [Bacillota bacterium]
MKLAIGGKGGSGKTTLAAGLCLFLAGQGYQVYAVDADPDASLGLALGFPPASLDGLVPLIEMQEVVKDRAGSGLFFVLNPRVDDLLDRYSVRHGNIRLLRMGAVKPGGSECYCSEASFLRAVVTALFLGRQDQVVMDMGAGIEGFTRGTARGVDLLIIVSEPSPAGVKSAGTIARLAADLGIPRVAVVGNKLRNAAERAFLESRLDGIEVLGHLRHDEAVLERSIAGPGGPPPVAAPELWADVQEVGRRVLEMMGETPGRE